MSTGLVGALMVEYHALDRTQLEIIEEAADRGIAILIKKGLASGRLSPAEAIPDCLAPSGVSSVVIGSLNPGHLETNLAIAIGG